MYMEQIDTSGNGKESSSTGESVGFVRLVDYALNGEILRTEEARKNCLKEMSKFDSAQGVGDKRLRNAEESYATADVEPVEISRENRDNADENYDEKPVDRRLVLSKNEYCENVFNDGNDDSRDNVGPIVEENGKFEPDADNFEDENDEESSALFDDKSKSIFIRRSSILSTTDDPSTRRTKPEFANGDREIGKKIAENPRKFPKKRAISFFDTLLALFVVGPLVIGQWRGIWTTMDIYDEFLSEWPCFILGTGFHILYAIGRDGLHGHLVEKLRINHGTAGRVAYDLVRLLYTYTFCVACNAQWRGGWNIFNRYCGFNIWVSCVCTTIFAAGLVILRCFRNLLAPPFIVVIDQPERVFRFPTRYNVNTRDWSLYILDCAFSVGVVGSLVVFVWRGVWVLFELHLFPENREYSAVGSLIIGYILVAVTFCLQPLMRYTCSRLKGLPRLLAADAFLLLSFLGTVNVWRGIWTVLDLWLLPDHVELSCWITHVGCFVFLVLLNCSNSILVRGVYIDAEEEEGRCVVFPCHYLRLFFKIERQKKEAKRQNLIAASNETQSRNGTNSKEVENETLLNCTNAMPTIIPANPESFV